MITQKKNSTCLRIGNRTRELQIELELRFGQVVLAVVVVVVVVVGGLMFDAMILIDDYLMLPWHLAD